MSSIDPRPAAVPAPSIPSPVPPMHGSAARATVLWAVLIAATLLTWFVGERGSAGPHVVALLALVSCVKGGMVILDFMALRHAPPMWRIVTLGWLVLVWALIGLAYWNGMPT